jgi:hypothetical protein
VREVVSRLPFRDNPVFSKNAIQNLITVVIYNVHGEKVMTTKLSGETMHDFNISALPSGLYFVKITTAAKTRIIKLVKSR